MRSKPSAVGKYQFGSERVPVDGAGETQLVLHLGAWSNGVGAQIPLAMRTNEADPDFLPAASWECLLQEQGWTRKAD